MMNRILTVIFLLFAGVTANSLRVEDEMNMDSVEAVPDEMEVDAEMEDPSLRNLYGWKHKYHYDCDDDCDCGYVIKAFENFFDCCVDEDRRRLGYWGGSSSSSSSRDGGKRKKKHWRRRKHKHCGYDKDFSSKVNYAIKCCDFDKLVKALE